MSPDRRRGAPRIALVHDWLTGMRGGEKVLEALCDLYPDAPVLHADPGARLGVAGNRPASAAGHRGFRGCPGPGATTGTSCRSFPPRPRPSTSTSTTWCSAAATAPSSRSCGPGAPATSVTATRRCATCGTSARRTSARNGSVARGPGRSGRCSPGWPAGMSPRFRASTAISRIPSTLRGGSPDTIIAGPTVVPPPVDTGFFHPDGRPAGDVCPGGVGPGAVQAARPRHRRLPARRDPAVHGRAGAGDATAAGPGWRTASSGWVLRSDEEIRELYRACAMVLLPGEEDFGIVPVEAQACGRPVVAAGVGGAVETVEDGVTGVLVAPGSAEALADGIRQARATRFDPAALRRHAEAFGRERFVSRMAAIVDETLAAGAGTSDMVKRYNRLLAAVHVLSDALLASAAFVLAYVLALRDGARPGHQGLPAVRAVPPDPPGHRDPRALRLSPAGALPAATGAVARRRLLRRLRRQRHRGDLRRRQHAVLPGLLRQRGAEGSRRVPGVADRLGGLPAAERRADLRVARDDPPGCSSGAGARASA